MADKLLDIAGLAAGHDPNTEIICGADLSVDRGEIVCLTGANGAGKSTLLQAIAGLLRHRRGRIDVGGVETSQLRPSAIIRLGVGYLPQRDNVFHTLTVEQNLRIGLRPRPDLEFQNRLNAMGPLIDILKARLGQVAGTLSGGERQVLGLVRALMPDPCLLVLDEPTAALAESLGDSVLALVRVLADSGTAVLLAEQNTRAMAIADRRCTLLAGKCIETVIQGRR